MADEFSDSRRNFLRLAGRRARRLALDASGVPIPHAPSAPRPPAAPSVPPGPPVLDAVPATATVGDEELAHLAQEAGLGARLGDVGRLARASVRLTPAQPGRGPEPGAWSGGGRVDEETGLTLVLHVALDDPAAGWLAACVPGARVLRIWTRPGEVDGPRPVRVELRNAGVAKGRPLALSVETVLPRVWAASVQALDLDEGETAGWEALRRTLAERQGTEPDLPTTPNIAWHRLGGHPNERSGLLPVACERQVAPAGLDDAALQERARRWVLLAQLSADPAGLGWSWGAGIARLYVFVDGEALRAGDVSGAVAVAR